MVFCGISKTSTLDYPGKLAAVLFSPGCNYDCFYCHNRALLKGDQTQLETSAVLDFLERRRGLLDGIVLTGGEATLQIDIVDFAGTLVKTGFSVKLDTNGSRPQVVAELLGKGLLDYVALDYKAPFRRYQEICGEEADPEDVQKTLQVLLDAKVRFELRTTVIPQLSQNDLMEMAGEVPKVPKFVLQLYRMPKEYKQEDQFRVRQKPYNSVFLLSMAKKMREMQPFCEVR